MQDRYLFRGKRIGAEKWVYGLPVEYFGDTYIMELTNFKEDRVYSDTPGKEMWSHEVDPATVAQCIGLKDKNGKLIFEGDIIKGRNDYEVSDVVYKDGVWTLSMFLGHTPALWEIEPIEVIGNIHDKSEVE